jgi:hypothetical protein
MTSPATSFAKRVSNALRFVEADVETAVGKMELRMAGYYIRLAGFWGRFCMQNRLR